MAADELLGTVERIDKEEGFAGDVRHEACGDSLFGDHRHLREGAGEVRQDDALGAGIGVGDRRKVRLVGDRRACVVDVENGPTR
ncbi:hypothetical protein D9M72_591160 [compost metagenome]